MDNLPPWLEHTRLELLASKEWERASEAIYKIIQRQLRGHVFTDIPGDSQMRFMERTESLFREQCFSEFRDLCTLCNKLVSRDMAVHVDNMAGEHKELWGFRHPERSLMQILRVQVAESVQQIMKPASLPRIAQTYFGLLRIGEGIIPPEVRHVAWAAVLNSQELDPVLDDADDSGIGSEIEDERTAAAIQNRFDEIRWLFLDNVKDAVSKELLSQRVRQALAYFISDFRDLFRYAYPAFERNSTNPRNPNLAIYAHLLPMAVAFVDDSRSYRSYFLTRWVRMLEKRNMLRRRQVVASRTEGGLHLERDDSNVLEEKWREAETFFTEIKQTVANLKHQPFSGEKKDSRSKAKEGGGAEFDLFLPWSGTQGVRRGEDKDLVLSAVNQWKLDSIKGWLFHCYQRMFVGVLPMDTVMFIHDCCLFSNFKLIVPIMCAYLSLAEESFTNAFLFRHHFPKDEKKQRSKKHLPFPLVPPAPIGPEDFFHFLSSNGFFGQEVLSPASSYIDRDEQLKKEKKVRARRKELIQAREAERIRNDERIRELHRQRQNMILEENARHQIKANQLHSKKAENLALANEDVEDEEERAVRIAGLMARWRRVATSIGHWSFFFNFNYKAIADRRTREEAERISNSMLRPPPRQLIFMFDGFVFVIKIPVKVHREFCKTGDLFGVLNSLIDSSNSIKHQLKMLVSSKNLSRVPEELISFFRNDLRRHLLLCSGAVPLLALSITEAQARAERERQHKRAVALMNGKDPDEEEDDEEDDVVFAHSYNSLFAPLGEDGKAKVGGLLGIKMKNVNGPSGLVKSNIAKQLHMARASKKIMAMQKNSKNARYAFQLQAAIETVNLTLRNDMTNLVVNTDMFSSFDSDAQDIQEVAPELVPGSGLRGTVSVSHNYLANKVLAAVHGLRLLSTLQ